ncbi:MAG: dihydropteroate synthase, partial [Bacteroidota bacterium]
LFETKKIIDMLNAILLALKQKIMVILGLGTNLGNRKAHLKTAILLLQDILTDIQISPIYHTKALLTADAPQSWDKPFLNMAVRGKTNLKPSELLRAIKNIERQMGRANAEKWSPRPIDIDILAWGDEVITQPALTIPHSQLLQRSFALLPLNNLAPSWTYPVPGPYQGITATALSKKLGHIEDFELMTLLKPAIVGILNITPDSFSDGGKHNTVEKAFAQYQLLVKQGASVIDIGAESTRPNATLLDPEEEWKRLEPILKKIAIHQQQTEDDTLLSLDSRHATTLEKALPFGITYANDVSGLYDEKMCRLIAQHQLKAILMHHTTIPADPQVTLSTQRCAVQEVLTWGKQRIEALQKAGIEKKQIIFDPGIGFGKTPYQSLKLIANLQAFHTLGCALMLGHSRKSFMKVFTKFPASQRDLQTALMAAKVARQVDYLRVHNVKATNEAIITHHFTSLPTYDT